MNPNGTLLYGHKMLWKHGSNIITITTARRLCFWRAVMNKDGSPGVEPIRNRYSQYRVCYLYLLDQVRRAKDGGRSAT